MRIFFSGIGGSGVSAIAGFAAGKGHSVSGSDRLFDLYPEHPVCRRLKAQGISIVPQDGRGIERSVELAVFSTAVERNNPDFRKAEEIGIPVKSRPEYLAEIVAGFQTLAVAGTSGKSTTCGMIAFLMERLGMAPNFIGGGRVKQFRTPANAGNYLNGGSDLLVIEACESDGSIVNYRPAYSLILNLGLDHHPVADTAKMFRLLSESTSGIVITGADDENLGAYGIDGGVQFSIGRKSRYQATHVEYGLFKTSFTVNGTEFEVPLPGVHKVYNALACIAYLSEMGVEAEEISGALRDFSGIERRFDIHLNEGGYLVVDDYAHNPQKIASLMRTMGGISREVCYIFQPHGYGPTRLMKEAYIEAFCSHLGDKDALFVLPIYYAGGTASKDISSEDVAQGVRASGRRAAAVASRDEIVSMPKKWASYVVFGARDDSLADLAENIAADVRKMTKRADPSA